MCVFWPSAKGFPDLGSGHGCLVFPLQPSSFPGGDRAARWVIHKWPMVNVHAHSKKLFNGIDGFDLAYFIIMFLITISQICNSPSLTSHCGFIFSTSMLWWQSTTVLSGLFEDVVMPHSLPTAGAWLCVQCTCISGTVWACRIPLHIIFFFFAYLHLIFHFLIFYLFFAFKSYACI